MMGALADFLVLCQRRFARMADSTLAERVPSVMCITTLTALSAICEFLFIQL